MKMGDQVFFGQHYFCFINVMKRILVPLLLAIVFTGCVQVKEPEFRKIEKLRLKNFGITEGVIAFNATYYNPNNFGVSVKEAEADVYIDSVYLGKFVQDSVVQVNKNADFSIPLSGKITLATALKIDLEDIEKRDILLKAIGSVKVGKAGVFVNKPFEYRGRHRLEDLKLNSIGF